MYVPTRRIGMDVPAITSRCCSLQVQASIPIPISKHPAPTLVFPKYTRCNMQHTHTTHDEDRRHHGRYRGPHAHISRMRVSAIATCIHARAYVHLSGIDIISHIGTCRWYGACINHKTKDKHKRLQSTNMHSLAPGSCDSHTNIVWDSVWPFFIFRCL